MRRFLILSAFLAAFAFPAQALAQSTVPAGSAGANQYVQTVATAVGPTAAAQPTTTTAAPSTQGLPFTGEDLILVVLTALILSATGFVLYRQVRDR